ncbi:DUF2474 family protein [Billgrantia azerbaijanica]|nr:DUF2474 family protein [Halomonas azerbaijanica]
MRSTFFPRRLAWLIVIWLISVSMLGLLSLGLRFVMQLTGLTTP